jgi:hypothetical protein
MKAEKVIVFSFSYVSGGSVLFYEDFGMNSYSFDIDEAILYSVLIASSPLFFKENNHLTLHRRYFVKENHRLMLHRGYF